MPTLKERLKTCLNALAVINSQVIEAIRTWFAPASFGVKDSQGEHFFVLADRLTVTKSGRLLFWRRGIVCAAVAEDKWERVLKGIGLDDVKATEN